MKSFDKYQEVALLTDKYPRTGRKGHVDALLYSVLGLNGEAGEVAEKFKKLLRDKDGKLGKEDLELILLELGDVLWYIAHAAERLGVPLSVVAQMNIKKLSSRYKRGKIGGSGDKR